MYNNLIIDVDISPILCGFSFNNRPIYIVL